VDKVKAIWSTFGQVFGSTFSVWGRKNLPNDNIGFVQVGRTEVTELLEYYFSFVLLLSSWFSISPPAQSRNRYHPADFFVPFFYWLLLVDNSIGAQFLDFLNRFLNDILFSADWFFDSKFIAFGQFNWTFWTDFWTTFSSRWTGFSTWISSLLGNSIGTPLWIFERYFILSGLIFRLETYRFWTFLD
jgi:hypothetical protein